MGLTEEFDDFCQEFKATKSQSYLKQYVREIREAYDSGEALKSTVTDRILEVALSVC